MDPDAPLAYYDTGSGPALVLLHGFCESKDVWKELEEALSLDYRVIVPDLPGHGDNIFSEDVLSIEYFADKVKALLDHLDISQCTLVGHSLGGYVALAFAEEYPDMVKGFGLFHSTAFEDSEEKKQTRDKTIEFIEKHGMGLFADSFVAPLFYPKNREALKPQIELLKETCKGTDKDAAIATIQAMRDRNERIEVLKKSKVPVLFIIGKDDNALPLDKALEQAKYPENHQMCILQETGHMGIFEKRDEALSAIGEFLQECYSKK